MLLKSSTLYRTPNFVLMHPSKVFNVYVNKIIWFFIHDNSSSNTFIPILQELAKGESGMFSKIGKRLSLSEVQLSTCVHILFIYLQYTFRYQQQWWRALRCFYDESYDHEDFYWTNAMSMKRISYILIFDLKVFIERIYFCTNKLYKESTILKCVIFESHLTLHMISQIRQLCIFGSSLASYQPSHPGFSS